MATSSEGYRLTGWDLEYQHPQILIVSPCPLHEVSAGEKGSSRAQIDLGVPYY